MMLTRSTVSLLLALVSSVTLTQIMATRNVYKDLSTSASIPTCQADYDIMNQKQPKLLINKPGLAHPYVSVPIQKMETLLLLTGNHVLLSTCMTTVDGSRTE